MLAFCSCMRMGAWHSAWSVVSLRQIRAVWGGTFGAAGGYLVHQ